MCMECQQWSGIAQDVWTRLFAQVRHYDTLVLQLPYPMNQPAAAIQQVLPRNEQQVAQVLAELGRGCPNALAPEYAATLRQYREQALASGRQQLAQVTGCVNQAEACVAQAVAQGQMAGLMSSFGLMAAATNATLSTIEANNRALWERDIRLSNGQRFFELLR